MQQQNEDNRMTIDDIAKLSRAMRRNFKKKTGIKVRGLNEMHINPKKNKKGLLNMIKK